MIKAVTRLALSQILTTVMAADPGNIRTVPLDPNQPVTIAVGTHTVTTLAFPKPIDAVIGHAVTSEADQVTATFQYGPDQPEDYLTLQCLRPGARTFITLLSDKRFYLFELQWSLHPDALVRFEEKPNLPQGREVSLAEVFQRRPSFTTAHLFNLLKLARGESVLRPRLPDLYETVETRPAHDERRYPNATTVINKVHRFAKHDALVLEGEIINTGDQLLLYDPRRLQIRIGSSHYPATLTQASGNVPVGQSDTVHVVLVGGVHGQREAISIQNAFYLLLPPPPDISSTKPAASTATASRK